MIDGKTIRSREKRSVTEKQTILYVREVDVLAVLADQTKVIIEFQMVRQQFFEKRVLLYAMNRFSQQLEFLTKDESSSLDTIYPVYIVSILAHIYFQEGSSLVSTFRILEENRLVPLLDEKKREMLKLVFDELPKYTDGDEGISSLLSDWCRYFTNQKLAEDANEDVRFAQQVLAGYKEDKEVQAMIENARLREIATRNEGRYEGRAEEQERIAINLLKAGMSLERVEKITGLGQPRLLELSREIEV
ncbi:PD-(D/E)XK nuclease family transposase [uncultured Vagococcus sp.]|uniref:PD-(D/E)XK nuclease family transposase n=1 Tax=uncultured Vagococcus sp. TaxID=189676 RepID=UPI0028D68DC1|nr:PD-(D/E)XK nuclease family transposase [uncultured Vagococcus sp.]